MTPPLRPGDITMERDRARIVVPVVSLVLVSMAVGTARYRARPTF